MSLTKCLAVVGATMVFTACGEGIVEQLAREPAEEVDVTDEALSSTDVRLEAETGALTPPMKQGTADGVTFVHTTMSDPAGRAAGSARYDFTLPTAGVWQLTLRVEAFGPDYDGLGVSVDGAPTRALGFTPYNRYVTSIAWTGTLSAGRHTVVLRGIDHFVRVDWLRWSSVVAPAINQFTASPASVPVGGASTLSWAVSDATALVLTGPGLSTSVTGTTFVVHPGATSTYTLKATGPGGSVQRSVTVSVGSSGFSVRGGQIYDPQGHLFQARGMNVDDVDIAEADRDLITLPQNWSANIIRLSPYNAAGGVPTYDHAKLERVVNAYTSRGIVVELNDGLRQRWGDVLRGQELADHVAYYRALATQFKNNPYVWLATPNEQGGNVAGDEADWVAEELAVVRGIRATGNTNIIVQGDTNWGQGATAGGPSYLERHAEIQRAAAPNSVAGLHMYNNRTDAFTLLQNEVAALRGQGYAVMVDEVSDANGTYEHPTVNGADATLRAVRELGIGMLAFRWYTVGAMSFTAGGRGQGARTSWGNKVWAMTHADD